MPRSDEVETVLSGLLQRGPLQRGPLTVRDTNDMPAVDVDTCKLTS